MPDVMSLASFRLTLLSWFNIYLAQAPHSFLDRQYLLDLSNGENFYAQ